MAKFTYTPLIHRILLGALYAIFFSGFALAAAGQSITNWIVDNYGPGILLSCVLGYAGTKAGLGWLTNKISRAVPTFDPPPTSSLSRSDLPFEETMQPNFESATMKSATISSAVADYKSASELKVTGKAQE